MSNTVDLVKAASERSYIKFEDMALETLRSKVQENPRMQSYLSKLNVAQNIDENYDFNEADGDNPESESGLKAEYDAYFEKKLKKAGVDSPAELDDEAKKKFFDDVSKGWVNGKGEK